MGFFASFRRDGVLEREVAVSAIPAAGIGGDALRDAAARSIRLRPADGRSRWTT